MHLVIISGTPRAKKASNTHKIITQFRKGYEAGGNTAEVHYLAERSRWEGIREAYRENSRILFALPLFVECIPGILMEFLETLEPCPAGEEKTLSFLVQGGFAEASQLRCCESYLEKLPGYLNCQYGGTLIKGNMFGLALVPEKSAAKMSAPFLEMGSAFARDGCFQKDKVTEFAKPEYFSKSFIRFFSLITPFQDMMFRRAAKSMGCQRPLDDRPLEEHVVS